MKNEAKYGVEWKKNRQKTEGGWAQKDKYGWRWHYIRYGTEYHNTAVYKTKKQCENEQSGVKR